jgi:quinol monooxygenase YgiN
MIRHIVLVRFDPDVSDAERAGVFAQLEALVQEVPGMVRFSGGGNVSPEGLSRGYTHAFTADFTDEAARDAYLAHPAHQAAGARLVSAAADGIEGLVVLDILVADD